MTDSSKNYTFFLESVLLLWPKKNELDTSVYLKAISNKVSDDFDETDLLVGFSGYSNLRIIDSDASLAMIEFNDKEDYPYRAKVIESNGSLLLESLKFQCPVCFGTGMNEGSECLMCGGLGWGSG